MRLKEGANIVLAERSKGPARGGGLGKSTLLAILGYCLGGGKGAALASPRLDGWVFTLDAEHDGRSFSVSRSTDGQGGVEVEGDVGPWLEADAASPARPGPRRIGLGDYRRMLGRIMFGLGPGAEQRRHPTFGRLASYCMRQGGRSGGYRSPFCSSRMQSKLDARVHNAYLLGLDWKLAWDLANARDQKRRFKRLEIEALGGMRGGGAGYLEAVMVRLEDRSRREEEEIRGFAVHREYAQLEREADSLAECMRSLASKRSAQAEALEGYRRGARQEPDASPGSVLATYREHGVLFPESVRRSLEEARRFHASAAEERRELVGSEIARLAAEVAATGRQIDDAGARREKIVRMLESHGAAEELAAMRARHEETVAEKADVSSRLGAAREIRGRCAAANAEIARLRERAESDFDASKGRRRDAILAFGRYSEALYGTPGMLAIGTTEGEYRFDAKAGGPGSRGAGSMSIFCYDLALASLWAGRPQSPGLLAHDSEIFDGVDERQVARALQTAAKESERLGFQYICAIDSDTVPRGEFDNGFEFAPHVAVTLTDRGDDGGLLGIRF